MLLSDQSWFDSDKDLSQPSLYDPDPENDEPWFLPVSDDSADLPPLPRADRTQLIEPSAWQTAQAAAAVDLARAAMAVGQLDSLVASMGQGAVARLAALETEHLLWAAGTPIPPGELARDVLDARAETDLVALQQARWALRRLEGQGRPDELRAFLGLHRREDEPREASAALDPLGRVARLHGSEFDAAATEFLDRMAEVDLHPIARGALARAAWAIADLSPEGDLLESAVWSARIMAADCLALSFVPLGQAGRRILRRGGSPEDRLRDHCLAVTEAAAAARRSLLGLRGWAECAKEMTARIKGRTPQKIIAALMAHPQALTATIESAAGVSRDATERQLARMQEMGLVREITGTRRFRIWSANA